MNAEIVITFEGTTESGNDFMARQSYLPNELKWGHCFSNMFSHPAPGTSQYIIDFSGYLPSPCNFLLLMHFDVKLFIFSAARRLIPLHGVIADITSATFCTRAVLTASVNPKIQLV